MSFIVLYFLFNLTSGRVKQLPGGSSFFPLPLQVRGWGKEGGGAHLEVASGATIESFSGDFLLPFSFTTGCIPPFILSSLPSTSAWGILLEQCNLSPIQKRNFDEGKSYFWIG